MSRENIIKFYAMVEENPRLQKKMQKIEGKRSKKDVNEQIVELAGKNNIYFTTNELIDYLASQNENLQQDLNQKVSGGRTFTKGELAAAKVAKKSIVSSAEQLANSNYKETYK
ncbi:MAG: Nif11-like leader peptide family natural product precursor [Clostridia bacterium]|nr:Nif11-like leader peptide family natural product precursor [Clostridia bacterium]